MFIKYTVHINQKKEIRNDQIFWTKYELKWFCLTMHKTPELKDIPMFVYQMKRNKMTTDVISCIFYKCVTEV